MRASAIRDLSKNGAHPKGASRDGARRRRAGRAQPRQLEMVAVVEAPAQPPPKPTWGGRREGAGRKPMSEKERRSRRRNVVHRARPVHKKRHPVHVTMRAKGGLPSFRQQRVHRMLVSVLERQLKRRYAGDFHVVHYSIQSNHLHVVIEATDKRTMRSGVSGLVIAFAKRLNKLLERVTGKVWGDRYHARELQSPTAVRNALSYLFQNYKHHGVATYGSGIVDHFTDAPHFRRWATEIYSLPTESKPTDTPRTWLLEEGWWRHCGLLHPEERPADSRP